MITVVLFLKYAALAIASFGLLTGWLIGRSGPDASVIATVLPALIAAVVPTVGVFLLARFFRKGLERLLKELKLQHGIAVSIGITIFAFSLYGGVTLGEIQRTAISSNIADAQLRLGEAELEAELEERRVRLFACSSLEKQTNNLRQELQLHSLDSSYFCGYLKPTLPSLLK